MDREIFVGRQEELDELTALLDKKTASIIVVKGRRRVGKTRLIEEFTKNLPTYKFTGFPPETDTTAQQQRDEFANQLSKNTGLPKINTDDWSTLFDLLSREVQKGRQVIVFDEISWMGSKDVNFLGKLKIAWDEQFKKNPKLILMLCGSISSWIDDNILNSTGFYGRISWTINLDPLPLTDCNKLLTALGFKGSTYEKFKILAITGGIPWYLEHIQGDYSAEENIRRQCFTDGGLLFEEFNKIFHEIFGKRDQFYKEIVKVLISGPRQYEEIAKALSYKSSGRLSEYLEDLSKASFISRNHTWSISSGQESRISQFRLCDNYLRFYLKYIEPRHNQIKKGRFKKIALSSLPGWDTIMGLQFENLVLNNRDKVIDLLNINPEDIIADNPFLQKAGVRQQGCQIDYLIQTKYKNLYVFEIKFSRNTINSNVINEVKNKIKKLSLPRGMATLPVLIHVNGVSEQVTDKDYFYKIIDFSDLI